MPIDIEYQSAGFEVPQSRLSVNRTDVNLADVVVQERLGPFRRAAYGAGGILGMTGTGVAIADGAYFLLFHPLMFGTLLGASAILNRDYPVEIGRAIINRIVSARNNFSRLTRIRPEIDIDLEIENRGRDPDSETEENSLNLADSDFISRALVSLRSDQINNFQRFPMQLILIILLFVI